MSAMNYKINADIDDDDFFASTRAVVVVAAAPAPAPDPVVVSSVMPTKDTSTTAALDPIVTYEFQVGSAPLPPPVDADADVPPPPLDPTLVPAPLDAPAITLAMEILGVPDTAQPAKTPTPPHTEILIAIGERTELWKDQDGVAHSTWVTEGHRESAPIRSAAFKQFLLSAYYRETRRGPAQESVSTALCTLEAIAMNEGKTHRSAMRVASDRGRILIDTGDPDWRVIEISADSTVDGAATESIRFTRRKGMNALPMPGKADILPLWDFVNCAEQDRILILAWLLGCLQPGGAYYGLSLFGGQGTAKSSATRRLRDLIDPNQASTASFPKDAQNLFIAANAQHVLAYDNVSHLTTEQSDWLCRISTGDGYRSRTLYTDSDETILHAKKPWIINGIPNCVTRGDLLDRTICTELLPIPGSNRRADHELDREWETAAPQILGALIKACSQGLRRLEAVHVEYRGRLPRMADAAAWMTACESALGYDEGAFLDRQQSMVESAGLDAIESDPIALAVIKLVRGAGGIESTYAELLADIHKEVDWKPSYKKYDPLGNPRSLSTHLTRIAPILEGSAGVRMRKGVRRASGSRVTITCIP